MRIATFNVENLFNRARALDQHNWALGRPILDAYQRVCALLEEAEYTDAVKHDILRELARLGLRAGDSAKFARLRQNRGRLVRRSRDGKVTVIADGRADWIGWVELTSDRVEELALVHTARVLQDVGADIVGVVEAENRFALKRFADAGLVETGQVRYPHVMVIDGNDERGINVGVLSAPDFPLVGQYSHVDDAAGGRRVFSRDCAEYHFHTPAQHRIVLLVNHFKSKGYGVRAVSEGIRRQQATRVAEIYRGLIDAGTDRVVVVGDLNDTPDSEALAPLLHDTDLCDISTHPSFDDAGRPGTYGYCTARNKLDYILLSPALFAVTTGGGIFRRGVWGGKRGTLWPIYDTMTKAVHAGSDHAAVYADLNLD